MDGNKPVTYSRTTWHWIFCLHYSEVSDMTYLGVFDAIECTVAAETIRSVEASWLLPNRTCSPLHYCSDASGSNFAYAYSPPAFRAR